ncbi:MAG: bifunctional pyr operon transcriptional regulator/uracil phosphoribosyltransferase PyrR [Salibacteraceae bacterium]
MQPRVILNSRQLELTINRLCRQLIENHDDFSNSVLIGLQPRGVFLAQRIYHLLQEMTGCDTIDFGQLDITFFRDDFRRRNSPLIPNQTTIDFLVENKKVVMIDDVLYTGRTIRAGLDAMLAFGRPAGVELLVLIDRRFRRHLPIQPDYTGKTVDSVISERVDVRWEETDGTNEVILNSLKKHDE